MKRLLLLSFLVLSGITAAHALAPDPTPTPSPTPVSFSPPVPQNSASASSALQSFFTPPAKSASSSAPDNTPTDAGLTNSTVEDDDDDMSPDEIQLWNWCKHNGVYVALGIAALLLFLRMASKPPPAK